MTPNLERRKKLAEVAGWRDVREVMEAVVNFTGQGLAHVETGELTGRPPESPFFARIERFDGRLTVCVPHFEVWADTGLTDVIK
jgi:hypothetical protein